MFSRPNVLFSILLTFSVGCATVSTDEFDERLANVDLDGDGVSHMEDCDDEDPSKGREMVWYVDEDVDGFGNLEADELISCEPIEGYVAVGGDCDDTDKDINPSVDELCWDLVDNNCDNLTDDPSAVDAVEWFLDLDGDYFGDEDAEVERSCEDLSGTHVQEQTDCDDSVGTTYPGAPEYCDGVDNNCDTEVDEDTAVDASTWYLDYDEDGYGEPSYTTISCEQPDGWAATDDDCDDMLDAVNPGASEYCDGFDNNCDDVVDEPSAEDAIEWYPDYDEDGYGQVGGSTTSCDVPVECYEWGCLSFVTDNTDCDDISPMVNPGEDEYCDGYDNNCDTVIDEDSAVDAATWYIDGDSDGYGTTGTTTVACDEPTGYAALSTDCDDTEPHINPGAADGPLNDYSCDGLVDSSTYLSNSFIEFTGENSDDQFGYTVGAIGDVDGDGLSDIAMSAPFNDDEGTDAGKVYIFLGSSLTTRGAMMAADADLMFTGAAAGDYLGFSFDGNGDLDGDGVVDLIMGAPGDSTAASNSGAVYLVTGSSMHAFNFSGTTQMTWNDGVLVGESSGDQAGYSVSFVYDFFGDGNDDIVVGAPYWDLGLGKSNAGIAYVFRSYNLNGAKHYLSDSPISFAGVDGGANLENGDHAGFSVDGLEDMGSDGRGEVAIGAPYCDDEGVDSGCAYIFLSDTNSIWGELTTSSSDVRIEGQDDNDHCGWSVASAGDFDGDSLGDLLVSAPGADGSSTNNGEVMLYSGYSALGSSGPQYNFHFYFEGVNSSDMVTGVSGAGDVDGDGVDDIVVSSPEYLSSSAVGVSYLLLSASNTMPDSYDLGVADYSFLGENSYDESGYSVSSAGDVNGDGLDDLLVSAPLNDDSASDAGKVYLILSAL